MPRIGPKAEGLQRGSEGMQFPFHIWSEREVELRKANQLVEIQKNRSRILFERANANGDSPANQEEENSAQA